MKYTRNKNRRKVLKDYKRPGMSSRNRGGGRRKSTRV